jgi:hypothetical protein
VTHEVKIGHEDRFLTLSDEHAGSSTRSAKGELWSFDARLVTGGLTAHTRVHLTDAALEENLPAFFAALASEWRGWPGVRTWASYEGGLSLSCAHDGLGHVQVTVRLAEANRREWAAEALVPLDAGQLERVARDVATFFG